MCEKNVGKRNDEWRFRRYLGLYTLLFVVIIGVIIVLFRRQGVTFVSDDDGIKQHYRALLYYSRYLRSAIKTVFVDHSLHIPTWDFTIGEGSDIFQALQYYVIGDPFAALSVAVPSRYIWLYYNLALILRLWCAGAAFMLLCLHTGRRNHAAVLTGAVGYTFCFWGLFTLARHPYFLNPMIYFPLIILGVEMVHERRRAYVLSLAVAVAALSNFYFFYNLVLGTVLYVAVRLLLLYGKQPRKMLTELFRIGLYSALGVGMAAILFAPVFYIFFRDTRMSLSYTYRWIGSPKYYRSLPGLVLGTGTSSWLCLGYTSPALLAMFLLWIRRGDHRLLRWLMILCTVVILCPALGQIFNGMSYVANRWCWIAALLVYYLLVYEWDSLTSLSRKQAGVMIVVTVLWGVLCIYTGAGAAQETKVDFVLLAVSLALVIGISRNVSNRRSYAGYAILAVVVVEILSNAVFCYTKLGMNLPAQTVSKKDLLNALSVREIKAVKRAEKQSGGEDLYFRYSGEIQKNDNMIGGLSSTSYYWTVSNSYVDQFRRDMELRDNVVYNYRGYDDNSTLETLAGVKYQVVKGGDGNVPYGFTEIEDIDEDYRVFRNENALPLLYTYDDSMPLSEWKALDAVEKGEALQQVMVLDDDLADPECEVRYSSRKPEAAIEYSGGITVEGTTYHVTEPGASITVSFQGLPNSETYLAVKGLEADREHVTQKCEIKVSASNDVNKSQYYWQKEFRLYSGRHDHVINMCYSETPVTWITLTFTVPADYQIREIYPICLPMDSYAENLSHRKESRIEHFRIDGDEISADVAVDRDKWLCMAFPYSEGWRAEVDGKPADLHIANEMYLGLKLETGTHHVCLRYRTPWRMAGTAVSVLSTLLFLTLVGRDVSERKKTASSVKRNDSSV